MRLVLHTPNSDNNLLECYQRALNRAVELYIVTAYLTDWDESLQLNSRCRRFRLIIGKDFGITRKSACKAVMRWLPPERKSQFMVAGLTAGFHPKAVFWKELDGNCFAIVGSSNLTRAAFDTNFEANAFSRITNKDYNAARRWLHGIETQAIPVSEDWLAQYNEATPVGRGRGKKSAKKHATRPSVALNLPRPRGMSKQIKKRRERLAAYRESQGGLLRLFRGCAAGGKISSAAFYKQLPKYWSDAIRLQGHGWEIRGRKSDFKALAEGYLTILKAPDDDRDDVVAEEIDALCENGVATRKAFLSEMLCLQFPSEYPILNKPVQEYLRKIGFRSPRGASEGSRYIDLARKLRLSLLQNPNYPANNLAELDAVIWLSYDQ